jgi:diaminohydroxyphosphoribosylaminopyrimidine deaminase/5-amino-6-(5-phosphoribosylamino)uracil reductase
MPVSTDIDRRHLARAIELAEGGRGRVSPNPLVGAVIGRRDEVLGEGFHQVLGGPHAEVEAIEAAAGHDLDGATLYVSLEPCCHHGRTPPCTEAITAAGIERVVVASDDPSEHASGRGLGILRDDGVEVVVAEGELATRARLINQPFRKHARTGRPWVLFKSAMTLDGKVATRGGDSKWISGEESRRLAHHWRAQCDAVAVGIGTALADDPQLTARIDGVIRQPRRVVFDSLARLPIGSKLVRDARTIALTVVVSRAAPRAATDALATHGADIVVATGENETARVRSTSLVPTGSPRSCSRAGRTWRAPSSMPARSTRCGCSWPRWCWAGAPPGIRSRAKGSRRSPTRRVLSRWAASRSETICSCRLECVNGEAHVYGTRTGTGSDRCD